MKHIFFIILVAPSLVFANCIDLIALAKERNVIIENKDRYQRNVNIFCNEYRNNQGNVGSTSFEGAYNYISASFGQSRSSKSEVYRKVCGYDEGINSSNTAYSYYLETIAPGAIDAYRRCEQWAKNDLNISLPQASVLPTEMSLSASFSSTTGGSQAELSAHTSSDVKCRWNKSRKDTIRLKNGSSASLNCNRRKYSENSFVNVIRDNEGAEPVSISWGKYDADGNPVNKLQDLQNQLNKFIGAVIPFNNECPNGWKEYQPAYGRFIRGIDKSEEPVDPEGFRDFGSQQNDHLKAHNHTITLQGRAGNSAFHHRDPSWGYDDWVGNPSSTQTNNAGEGAETRPKNVALLYCIKNQ